MHTHELVYVWTGVVVFHGSELECREHLDGLMDVNQNSFQVREMVGEPDGCVDSV